MEEFGYLTQWYEQQCDGEWEHQNGISLQSLDNPGWILKVDLAGTNLQGSKFKPVHIGVASNGQPNESVWMSCRVRDGQFVAACSPDMLSHALDTFQLWSSLYASN